MVTDQIKDKSYFVNRFKVNQDYIKRLKINQRRYFSFNLNKPRTKKSSLDFSVDDQILKDIKKKKVRKWSSRVTCHLFKGNIFKQDDLVIEKYLPLSTKSRGLV